MRIIVSKFFLIFLVLIIALIIGYFNINKDYSYSYSECEGGFNYEKSDFVKKIFWEENTLVINPEIEANCGVKSLRENVRIKEDEIILSIDEKFSIFAAMCNCAYEAEFKFKNLEKKDYKIILEKNGIETDSFIYRKNGKIEDKCSENISYDCYFPEREEELNESYTFEIVYREKESEEVAKKYPKFEEYLKNYRLNLEGSQKKHYVYELFFKESEVDKSKNYIMIRGNGETGLIAGETFEEGIKNYINKIENNLYNNKFLDMLRDKYPNLEVLYAVPDKRNNFYFRHNNETIKYSSSPKIPYIKFVDRGTYLTLGFIGAQDAGLVSEENLIKYVDNGEKVQKYIESKNYRMYLSKVEISEELIANFKIEEYTNEGMGTITIHNNEIKRRGLVNKEIEIDIKEL